MTTAQRILLVSALIVAAHVSVRATARYFEPLPALKPEQVLADVIPTDIEPDQWHGKDVVLPPEVVQKLAPEAVVNREYRSPLGETVAAHVAVFTEYGLAPPHPPLACYPAAGWTLKDTRFVTVDREDPAAPEVPVYSFERRGEQVLVMFWIDLNGEFIFDRDGLRGVVQRLAGQHTRRPLLKKVMLYTSLDNPDKATLRLQRVAQAMFAATSSFH